MLEINLPTLIFAIINFVILAVGLSVFLYKPITNMLDQRKQAIDQALSSAARCRQETEAAGEALRAQTAAARREADEIVAQGRTQAQQAADAILAQAQQQAEQLTAASLRDIETAKARALQEARGQIAELALDAAEKLLSGHLTSEQQQRLLNDYIEQAGPLS